MVSSVQLGQEVATDLKGMSNIERQNPIITYGHTFHIIT